MATDSTSIERTIGQLEARVDAVEQRLARLEDKIDDLTKMMEAARGGWKLILTLGAVCASVGGLISHFLHYFTR